MQSNQDSNNTDKNKQDKNGMLRTKSVRKRKAHRALTPAKLYNPFQRPRKSPRRRVLVNTSVKQANDGRAEPSHSAKKVSETPTHKISTLTPKQGAHRATSANKTDPLQEHSRRKRKETATPEEMAIKKVGKRSPQ